MAVEAEANGALKKKNSEWEEDLFSLQYQVQNVCVICQKQISQNN